MNEDGFVLIGPNGWPIVGMVVFMAFVGWWLAQSGKPPRQGPTFWEGVRWSALKTFFPGVHAWYVSSISGGGEGECEDEESDTGPDEAVPNRSGTPDAQRLELTHFDTNRLIFELTKRPLEREQVLTVMARAKKVDGTDWMSANKISSAIGGTNADNMAIISALRPKKEAPAEPPRGSPLYRPKNGW